MVDGRKYRIIRVACSNPAIECCFLYVCFKPIPNLKTNLNHSELMPKRNLIQLGGTIFMFGKIMFPNKQPISQAQMLEYA